MIGSHLTDRCVHACSEWCIHCEEGCKACGALDQLTDNAICFSCEEARRQFLNEMDYEDVG